jgi:hypothetical protein
MIEYPERRRSLAAGWARGTGSFAAVLLLTVLIGHMLGLVETLAFLWVLGIAALLAALALLFAGFAFSRFWNFGDYGGRDLTIGAVLALLVLAPYGVAAYWIATLPALHDISTDLDNPPDLPTAASRTAEMNSLSAPTPGERRLQAENYPLVTGHSYDLPIDRVVQAVKTVLGRRDWQLVAPVPDPTGQNEITIGAVARSFILELPADVAIRITTDGDSTLVDMRSASRYGRHDLGDNARRIADFLAELDQEIAAQAGAVPVE